MPIFRILAAALAFCYLLISLIIGQKYLRTSDVVRFDFLRCANKECKCIYENAKYGILNGLFLH